MKKSKKVIELQKAILNILKQNPGVPINRKDISRALGVTKQNYHLFMDSIVGLAKEGTIIHVRKSHYAFPQKSKQWIGELRVTRSGFGFVYVESEDIEIFVSQPNLNTAFDRDIVEVQLYSASRGKRLEGFVKRIVKRFREYIVGTYHKTDYYDYVTPDDQKITRDILVHQDNSLNARSGQKVLVKFERWEKNQHNPEGTIVEILGDENTPGLDVVSVAYSYNIPVKFDDAVEEAAKNAAPGVDNKDLQGRLDLRDKLCFTIDPVDAKDFDDAVSLEKLQNGHWLLGVHIADVSHYVKEGSLVDKEAFRRGSSVYLVDRVIPMLPEYLSNELCSLKPNVDRLTFSCLMEFDEGLNIVGKTISPSVIHSKRRFNYQEAQQIINGKIDDPLKNILIEMNNFAKKLTKKRFEKGGIDFETPEVRFVLDKQGKPIEIIPRERLDTHKLIEEFMLAANQAVTVAVKNRAKELHRKLPFIYRVHEKPSPEKMQKLYEFLYALQIKFKPEKSISPRFFQKLLNSIKGTKEEMLLQEVTLRSMMKASYSEKNIGHFGLGFSDYTHFTSPIRRYPDLTVHRLLRQYFHSKEPASGLKKISAEIGKIARQSSKTERLAIEAERDSIKIKQLEYIKEYVGKEFTGIVSGVMSFGIFVELEKSLIEGLIAVASLTDDFYIFDDKTYSMVGRDTENMIRLADEVRVRVENVDIEKKEIDFTLIENISDRKKRTLPDIAVRHNKPLNKGQHKKRRTRKR